MAAVSYSIVAGGVMTSPVQATQAPSAGVVEIRIDQSANAITDSNAPGGTRTLKRGEALYLLDILKAAIETDYTNFVE